MMDDMPAEQSVRMYSKDDTLRLYAVKFDELVAYVGRCIPLGEAIDRSGEDDTFIIAGQPGCDKGGMTPGAIYVALEQIENTYLSLIRHNVSRVRVMTDTWNSQETSISVQYIGDSGEGKIKHLGSMHPADDFEMRVISGMQKKTEWGVGHPLCHVTLPGDDLEQTLRQIKPEFLWRLLPQ